VPAIVSEVTGNTVYLKCSFESNSNGSLGYMVAWSRLSPEGRKEELKQETTIHTSAFIELDGFNLRLGDRVCFWAVVQTFLSRMQTDILAEASSFNMKLTE